MEYKILNNIHLGNLQEEVNDHLKLGWDIVGGIVVSAERSYAGDGEYQHWTEFYQTMVKH